MPERAVTVETAICERLQAALNVAAGELDPEQSLMAMGLGSLELAELKEALEHDLGIVVPLSGLMDGWSIRDIVRAAVDGGPAAAPPAEAAQAFERVMNPELGRLLRRLDLDKRYVRADGCWLYDPDGRAYLDTVAGFGSVPFGHNPPEVWAAMAGVLQRGEPAFVQPSSLEAAAELAERLLAVAPAGLRYVTFCNSGAEAAEVAIKLARSATGRLGILSAADGFHGKTLGALSATGRPVYQEPFGAPAAGFATVPFGDVAALEAALSAAPAPAAFIVEPIQGEAGIVEAPPGYLAAARELCTRHGVLLLLDEVQTGLGRTGRLFACQWDGVAPDVLMLAKALGGGVVPMAAVLYNQAASSKSFWLRHSSTFAGHAVGARAGLAVLDLLARDGGALLEHVRVNGALLRDGLLALQRRFPGVVTGVRGTGFMLGVELTDGEDLDPPGLIGLLAQRHQLSALVTSHLLNVGGVRVAPSILNSRVIRIEPPLVFTADQCRSVLQALAGALEPVSRGDTAAAVSHLLPGRSRVEPRPLQLASPGRAGPVRGGGPCRWAFLAHPIDTASYAEFDPSLDALTEAEIGDLTARLGDLLEPFAAGVASVVSSTGATAAGQFVVVPRSTRELADMEHGAALELLEDAIDVARRAGAEVIGLGGHISVVSGAGLELGAAGVRLTTGNSYTAVVSAQAAADILRLLDVDPGEATVAVVGAAGSVGRSLAALLAPRVGRLLLVGNPAHPERSLVALRTVAVTAAAGLLRPDGAGGRLAAAAWRHAGGLSAGELAAHLLRSELLVVGTDTARLLPEADLVVTATSSTRSVVDAGDLGPGAVVYELARPSNVSAAVRAARPDVLVIDGGVVRVPECSDLGWQFGLPAGTAFACMCEPILLSLEDRLDRARLGVEPASLAELEELGEWGRRHGFELAAFRSAGRPVESADWARVAAARRRAPRTAPT